jgi:hypothetical protein
VVATPDPQPEEAAQTGIGIDQITEFFLLGSFASWLVALASLALAAAS